MPQQRIYHSRITYDFPDDFPKRRLGTHPETMRRWTKGVRPNAQHMMALRQLSDSLGIGHLFTDQHGGGWLRKPHRRD